jgi:MoaD family protein
MVTLRLFAGLRDLIGKKEVGVAKDDSSLKEVLKAFSQEHGDKVQEYLFDEQGEVQASVMLLINNEPTTHGTDTKVKAGDVVSILLPTAGG